MKFIFFNILFFWTMIFGMNSYAQGFFKGHAILGINAAQLDGDDLAGYNMVGLTGGLKVSFPLKERMDFNMEMLFSQRGSRSEISFSNPTNLSKTVLRYFEIPLYITYSDWFQPEDNYYKVSAHGGLSYGYLFSGSSTQGGFDGSSGSFKKNDLALLIGVNYAFTKHISMTVRYTTSLFNVYQTTNGTNLLRSYFLTFRSEYKF